MTQTVSTLGYTATIPIATIEDLYRVCDPPIASTGGEPTGEVVAFGTAVYEAIKPAAYDAHKMLSASLAHTLGLENVWFLPSRARMPYPYSILYSVASMLKTEKHFNRKADWFLWIDDDVVVQKNIYDVLRAAADPKERPFVAAAACDRNPPFKVAVWSTQSNGAGLEFNRQWVVGKPDEPGDMEAPTSGLHRIAVTGLCAALFHRSLFDIIPQPWFAVIPGDCDKSGNIGHKINTDSWWSQQLHDKNIPVYVTCDTTVVHMGGAIPVSMQTAPILRQVFRK